MHPSTYASPAECSTAFSECRGASLPRATRVTDALLAAVEWHAGNAWLAVVYLTKVVFVTT